MGRVHDLSIIRSRLKRGVSPDTALESRVSGAGGLIYLIVQKSTGLEYIGLTSTSLDERWSAHVRDAQAGSPYRLHSAIRATGTDDFGREILEDGIQTEDELCERELHYIAKFGTLWPGGLNGNRGGAAGGGQPHPCVFSGEEFQSITFRNEVLGERYGKAPWTIARLIREGRPLDTAVRTVHEEHLGNETWQRQWRSVVRSANISRYLRNILITYEAHLGRTLGSFVGDLASSPAFGLVLKPVPRSLAVPSGPFSGPRADRMRMVRNQEEH